MSQRIVISMDAKEILDKVDDMLAWEAIACQADKMNFHAGHFYRAKPMVDVGAGEYGIMTPSSVDWEEPVADEAAIWRDFSVERIVVRSDFRAVAYARMIDCRDVAEPALLDYGDSVEDKNILTGDLGASKFGAWKDATYHIESVGEVSGKLRLAYINSLRAPQATRVFLQQSVMAFKDGRAASGVIPYLFFNGRLFWADRTPVKVKENGNSLKIQNLLIELIAEGVRRKDQWDVELALSKNRTGIALATDSTGALGLVNMLRSSDTQAGRRKTLVHWVDEHMRRRRATDPEAEIRVRAHFRGKSMIDAGRYHIRIYPPEQQLAKAANGDRYDIGKKLQSAGDTASGA